MTKKRSSTKRTASKKARRDRVGMNAFLHRTALTPMRGVCTTCRHPRRQEIEADCRSFLKKRTAGKTHLPFHTFVLRWIKPTFDLRVKGDGLRTHMENCCGLKVA